MIQSKNLDNQTFEEITAHAVSRIPGLSGNWTNFNLSDPGITLVDLFAWYKEMQQYHLNFFSDEIAERLLALTGTYLLPEKAAECMLLITEDPERDYPALTKLETKEGIVFELAEKIPDEIPEITGIHIIDGRRAVDVRPLLNEGAGISPFRFEGKNETELVMQFNTQDDVVSVWFEISEHSRTPRNPLENGTEPPRIIEWYSESMADNPVIYDETNSLSKSGRIAFKLDGKHIIGTLKDPGCEEEVIIRKIEVGHYKAVQKETMSDIRKFVAPNDTEYKVVFDDALALVGEPTVFIRTEVGWKQIEATNHDSGNEWLRELIVNTSDAVQDDGENLMVCMTDPIHFHDLFFDSTGMPGQELQLELNGKMPVRDHFILICDTREPDGSVAQEEWREVNDFHSCDSRSRVFIYDRDHERIIFGDGERGAIVPAGENAIFVAEIALSECAGGNVPKNAGLYFSENLQQVDNDEASGGRNRETIEDAMMRFRYRMNHTKKCTTVEDYERAAKETPGLRVADAHAVPGFDRMEPTRNSRYPVVTVVVVPDSDVQRPQPDKRFLNAVKKNIDDRRTVGTMVRVTGPLYIPVDISLEIMADEDITDKEVRNRIQEVLRTGGRRSIGDLIALMDIESAVTEIRGVMNARHIYISSPSPECARNAYGDLVIPKDAIAYLRKLRVTGR
ncbi:putative baseplate assembly protein [Lachnospiraceae bacterium]|nr:putative baseplate assembly protein [Lachnospiraceae bacterium]